MALGNERGAASRIEVGCNVLTAGLEIRDDGSARADAVEIFDSQGLLGFLRDGQKMQDGVCGAARSCNPGDGIFDGGASEDAAGPEVAAQDVHDQFAGAAAGRAFGSVRRRHAGEAHRGDAEKFADEGPRVGRKLPAAGARSRAGRAFEFMELRIGESAAGMRADRFVNILDGDGMPLELTGSDGGAVENQAGNVEASERHDAAGNGFVAADTKDESIEEV